MWFQKDVTKLCEEEGPNNKKPEAKNWFFEEPALNMLYHVYKMCKESGSDNKNIEEIVKGEYKKNLNKRKYTNMAKVHCKRDPP